MGEGSSEEKKRDRPVHAHTHTLPTHPNRKPQTPTHSTQCKGCLNRTFADTTGLARCKVCGAGSTYDVQLENENRTASPCAKCRAGTYRDNARPTTDTECTLCGRGKSSAAVGAVASSTCANCAPGKVGQGTGLAACTDCDPGFFSFSFTACSFCQKGKFTRGAGAAECEVRFRCSYFVGHSG